MQTFKTPGSGINKLFLSRVGDVALDVPDANVIIQISSHYGSRLQEAQRMGRILRRGPQRNAASGFNSFFYTLVSGDTLEMYFANKRRRYLVDQGYAYKVLNAGSLIPPPAPAAPMAAPALPEGDDTSTDAGLKRLADASSFVAKKDEQLNMLAVTTQCSCESATSI